MNWGEVICGLACEPSNWDGGIVSDPSGRYAVLRRGLTTTFELDYLDHGWLMIGLQLKALQPVFPPPLYADLGDVALYRALSNKTGRFDISDHTFIKWRLEPIGQVHSACWFNASTGEQQFPYDLLPLMVRDMQNALLLCQRLGWVK